MSTAAEPAGAAQPGDALLDLDLGPPADPHDPHYALAADGLLGRFNAAGVIAAVDVHVATRIAGQMGERGEEPRLALALTVRAVRHGSVCLDLTTARDLLAVTEDQRNLPWPAPGPWLRQLQDSPLVDPAADPARAFPLRLEHGQLYLDKYWRQEGSVADFLTRRATQPPAPVDLDRLETALDRLFPAPADSPAGHTTGHDGGQRLAAALAALRPVTVIAGGPGTGKTTTVARLLAVLHDQPGPRPRIALAAPTGKAAARLQEAVRDEAARLPAGDAAAVAELTATTIHRLLGWVPGRGPRYNRTLPLPFDVVVIDESSMVALTGMADLLAALAPSTSLVLVGDPDQLSSVEAGAVLGDIVARPARPPLPGVREALDRVAGADDADLDAAAGRGVCVLRTRHRFVGDIADFADAVRAGDPAAALEVLDRRDCPVTLVQDEADLHEQIITDGRALWRCAEQGDAAGALQALSRHRLLCAHRHGPYGASWWGQLCRRRIAQAHPDWAMTGPWYPGRPLLVLTNTPDVGVYNGDSGVVVATPAGPRVAFGTPSEPRLVAPSRLRAVDSLYAMTIHKSQGSQFDAISVLLPPAGSPLLTRELLYTAVTRARTRVRLIGPAESVVRAIARPVQRASGLRDR